MISFNNYLIQQHKIGLTNLLYYGDIIAMKHSVENRSLFMDHRLVDYAFEADGYLKVNGSIDKYVLRRGEIHERFRDLLERRKIGFASPISPTIKKKMMSQLADSEILEFPIISQNLKLDIQTEKFKPVNGNDFFFGCIRCTYGTKFTL